MMNLFAKLLGRRAVAPVELHAAETCPECGSRLARGIAAADAVWSCPNPDCPPQVLKRVQLWAAPEAVEIQGCDAALVTKFVQRGLVRDAADFYRLKLAEIAAVDGMSKELAQRLFDAITASMKREGWRVLVGLGIPNVGVVEAQALCRHFITLDDLFATGRERLAKLEGVTETVARSLVDWYGDPVNRKLVRRLAKAGVNVKC